MCRWWPRRRRRWLIMHSGSSRYAGRMCAVAYRYHRCVGWHRIRWWWRWWVVCVCASLISIRSSGVIRRYDRRGFLLWWRRKHCCRWRMRSRRHSRRRSRQRPVPGSTVVFLIRCLSLVFLVQIFICLLGKLFGIT